MSDVILAITMLWLFVFVYSIAASIDFGAGFWSMVYQNHEQTKATRIANRYLSPSWEVTNVFIVLIVVALVTFFPGATAVLATVLLLPVSIILLLLTLRSSFLVFSHAAKRYRKTLTYVSGITGFFIPSLLILVLPITQGGFIGEVDGVQRLLFGKLLTTPGVYSYMLFAITSTLFLSSLLLADYSHASEEWEAYDIYRRDAVVLGPITLLLAMAIVVNMQHEAAWLYDNLTRDINWLVLSVIAFVIGYSALFWSRAKRKRGKKHLGWPRYAVIFVVLQYLFAGTAYGKAHLPYMVYPSVTIESGFTHPNMFRALFWSYIVGFAILIPGFIFFWRMFMIDKKYLKQHE